MKNTLKFSVPVLVVFVVSSFTFSNASFLPTKLKVSILDELGNQVNGAKVTLFKTEEDYRAGLNPVAVPIMTNETGVANFANLEPISYYVLAEKDKKSNYGAGVKTQKIEEGKVNKVNVVIRQY